MRCGQEIGGMPFRWALFICLELAHPLQKCLPEGASIAPVIISTDKTQLMQFSRGKLAYPVYLMLGNIPRALWQKPSQHACVLIAYLSVGKDVS